MGNKMYKRVKDFDELTISDDFMFGIIMRDPALCKPFLERILNIPIRKIEYPESQKVIDITADAKSVRLDIYVEDDTHKVYNIEMQTSSNRNLPKRTRYYQAMIDLNNLEKGEDYQNLCPSIIIFVCRFDPFGKDHYLYTFENMCQQLPELKLNDQTRKIFVNTKGGRGIITPKQRALFEFIDHGKLSDSYTQELNQAVNRTKANEKWRSDYMTYALKLREEYSEGRAEGRAEGRTEGKIETLIELVEDDFISAEEASSRLNMSVSEFRKLMEKR